MSSSADEHVRQYVVDGHLPEAVYVYRDEHGMELGAVARFSQGTLEAANKTFRQFRKEKDKWCLGLNGLLLPIYRLPEVLAGVHQAQTLLVLEGEKKVDAVRELGLLATSSPGGAGKWRESYSNWLREADVVLIPDNDTPGRKHIEQVARMVHPVARRVRVLELPGLPDAGDIVDWLEAGGTLEELLVLLASAPDWEPPVQTNEDWPMPTPFGVASEPEPLEVDKAMPECMAEFSHAVAESVKVDIAAPALLLPIVVSSATGNVYRVRVSPSYAEPNLARYGTWIASSGERKSETFRRTVAPLDTWTSARTGEYKARLTAFKSDRSFLENRAREFERKGSRATGEDVERWRAEAETARLRIPTPPRRPDLYIGDVTSEFLVRMMDEAGGAFAVLCADARHVVDAFLGRYRRDGRTDDSVYLRAHGGDRIDRGRIGIQAESEFRVIERPSLAIAICIQPDKISDLASSSALQDSGLIARINFVHPRSLVGGRFETGVEEPMDLRIVKRWERIVHALIDERWRVLEASTPEVSELVLDRDAMEMRRHFANEIERRQANGMDLALARAFASKVAGEAGRLAATYHLTVLAEEGGLSQAREILVPTEIWEKAEYYQRAQLNETLRVFTLAKEGEDCRLGRRLLEWAATQPEKRRELAARDVVAGRLVDNAEKATGLLEWLVDRGWARRLSARGREKAARWELHPVTFRSAAS